MENEFTVRRAEIAERDQLIALLNSAFSRPGFEIDFSKSHPYLFHQERIPNHVICLDGSRIIGNIGVYPYNIRIGGEVFKAAGIGQVASRAEYRDRGVMSSLLRHIGQMMKEDGIEFSWLYGDRLRYGRYGWVKGGRTLEFEMYDKYLPEPPNPERVRTFDPESDISLLKKHLNSIYAMQCLTDRDIAELIRRKEYTGYVYGSSFIITHIPDDTVEFASGSADEIALLLAHFCRELRGREGDYWKLTVETGHMRTPLMRVCERSYWQVHSKPSAMFRIVAMTEFFRKMCRIRTGILPLTPGELPLKNRDTGEEVTLVCDEISITVREGAEDPYELNTRELSEVCFGWCPLDLFLPDLPANSTFRTLFPFHFHLPRFLAL